MTPSLQHFHSRIVAYQRDPTQRPVVVCCLGDSVTRGWGHGSILYREAYPTRLIAALHDRYPGCAFQGINAGVGGDTITRALDRLERDVTRYEPDLTIVCFGLNDAMGGPGQLPQFTASLRTASERIGATGSAIILLTPNMMATYRSELIAAAFTTSVEDFIMAQNAGVLDAYVAAMRQVALEQDIPLADAYAIWQAMAAEGVDTTALLANGINHPFGHAHRFFVDALLDTLERSATSRNK